MGRKRAIPGSAADDDAGRQDGGCGSAAQRPDHRAELEHESPTTSADGPSRSERKRQDLQLRDLGVALVALPAAECAALDLPEALLDAVEACRRITSHGARLRQEMYIAKIMRHLDVEAIRVALERRSESDRQRVRREHALEQWRDRLLADEPDAWTDLATRVDGAALQELRGLVRQARAEHSTSRPPAAARRVFRKLRELLADDPGGA